jgi:transcriptional regulator with XRE-family HTH domain
MTALGKAIREARDALGWSQTDLAVALRDHGFGTTPSLVSRWENGKQKPHSCVLAFLRKILDTDLPD